MGARAKYRLKRGGSHRRADGTRILAGQTFEPTDRELLSISDKLELVEAAETPEPEADDAAGAETDGPDGGDGATSDSDNPDASSGEGGEGGGEDDEPGAEAAEGEVEASPGGEADDAVPPPNVRIDRREGGWADIYVDDVKVTEASVRTGQLAAELEKLGLDPALAEVE